MYCLLYQLSLNIIVYVWWMFVCVGTAKLTLAYNIYFYYAIELKIKKNNFSVMRVTLDLLYTLVIVYWM